MKKILIEFYKLRQLSENQAFIDRFRGTFSKTDAVQSRVKMLEKLVLVQVDEVDTSALKLKFPPAARSGNYPVVVKDLHKKYFDKVIFKDANIVIERGEKVLSTISFRLCFLQISESFLRSATSRSGLLTLSQ